MKRGKPLQQSSIYARTNRRSPLFVMAMTWSVIVQVVPRLVCPSNMFATKNGVRPRRTSGSFGVSGQVRRPQKAVERQA